MNMWELYTILQDKERLYKMTFDELYEEIQNMDERELKEGVFEFLLLLKRGIIVCRRG